MPGLPAENKESILTLRASSRLAGNVGSQVRMRDFTVTADEPADLGGDDRGPTPMEYALGSLVSCMTVMIRLIAAEKEIRVDDVAFEVEGDLNLRGLTGTAPVRPDFLEVRGTVWLDTPEEPGRIAELRDEVYRRCPVYNLFRRAGIPVRLEWRARGRSGTCTPSPRNPLRCLHRPAARRRPGPPARGAVTPGGSSGWALARPQRAPPAVVAAPRAAGRRRGGFATAGRIRARAMTAAMAYRAVV